MSLRSSFQVWENLQWRTNCLVVCGAKQHTSFLSSPKACNGFYACFFAAIMSIALSPKLRTSSAFSFISSNAFSIGAG